MARHAKVKNGKMSYYMRKKLEAQASQSDCGVILETSNETDEEIHAKLRKNFSVLKLMAEGACKGDVRALIASGPAGLGKSFEIERAVTEYSDATGRKASIIKGFVRATGLYKLLYQHSNRGQVLVIDDADSIYHDTDTLNLLKAACDTTETRRISWMAETRMTDDNGVLLPTTFEFNGSIIFITNYDFDHAIDSDHRLTEHFKALISRAHYINMGMRTKRDYLIRIRQVVDEGMLSAFKQNEQQEIVDYVFDNSSQLRELTLRAVVKIANLYKTTPSRWKEIASVTMMKHGAGR